MPEADFGVVTAKMRSDDLYQLPPDLPVPIDDGAASHLPGTQVPAIALPSTAGRVVTLSHSSPGVSVVYCYPRTGEPDVDPPGGLQNWNSIPGARGCTPQSCAYRNRFDELRALGATVYGLSTQSREYQRAVVERLQLPFELLSDADGAFASALRLPSFEVAGMRLLRRLTLIIRGGMIAHCIYPVFPPDGDAQNVIHWLSRQMANDSR